MKIMGIECGEEVQAEGISNIFNEFLKNSQILRKSCPLRYKKPPEHQIDMNKLEPPHAYCY
jgi:hypothetical protein